MSKANADKNKADLPLEGLLLECQKDRYKLSYAALRWAKEIKQKENLPDPIPVLVLRALREILTGKIHIKDVEKLSIIPKMVAMAPPSPAPTLTLTASSEPSKKED